MEKTYSSKALFKMAGGGGMHSPHPPLDPPLGEMTIRLVTINILKRFRSKTGRAEQRHEICSCGWQVACCPKVALRTSTKCI